MSLPAAKILEYRFDRQLRRIAQLLGVQAFVQVCVLGATPVLSRLYSPEDFGAYSVFLFVVSLSAVISSLGLYVAVPVVRSDTRARGAAGLSIACATLFAFVATTAVAVAYLGFPILREQKELRLVVWLWPTASWFVVVVQTHTYFAIRKRSVRGIARLRIAQAVGQVTGQAVLGLAALGAIGLAVGYLIGQFAAWVVTWRSLGRISPRLWWIAGRTLRRLRSYPTFLTPSLAIYTITSELPVVLLSATFGIAVAGHFGFAYFLIRGFVVSTAQAITEVVFGELAALDRASVQTAQMFEDLLTLLCVAGAIPLGLVALDGPTLFALVFGEEWRESGLFARYLSIGWWSIFVVSPLASKAIIQDRQQAVLVLYSSAAIIGLSGIAMGIVARNAPLGVLLYSVGVATSFCGYLIWLAPRFGASLTQILRSRAIALGMAFVIFAALLLLKTLCDPLFSLMLDLVVFAVAAGIASRWIVSKSGAGSRQG